MKKTHQLRSSEMNCTQAPNYESSNAKLVIAVDANTDLYTLMDILDVHLD